MVHAGTEHAAAAAAGQSRPPAASGAWVLPRSEVADAWPKGGGGERPPAERYESAAVVAPRPAWLGRTERPAKLPAKREAFAIRAAGADGVAGQGLEAAHVPALRRADARLANRALELRLCGSLGATTQSDRWRGGEPTAQQRQHVEALRADVCGHVEAATDAGRTGTAFEFWADFLADTQREPFVDPAMAGGARYNAETLTLFAADIRMRGSRKPGQRGVTLKSGTVEGYVSAIRVYRERTAEQPLAPNAGGGRLSLMYKRMRFEDGPKGDRKLSRGIRAYMLVRLAAMGYDRSSARGVTRWAAALLAHNLLLRGGEIGHTSKCGFDERRDISFASVTWELPCEESEGCEWGTVDVVAIKDTHHRHAVCPMPVRRRAQQGARGADPLCTYDALRRLWDQRMEGLNAAQRRTLAASRQPLFIGANGRSWSTTDSRELAQDMATRLGERATDFGGKAFRIAGATDLRDVMGAASIALIKQRGRWWSDVAMVYQRMLSSEHLDASARIGGAASRDMEAMRVGWVQRAHMR